MPYSPSNFTNREMVCILLGLPETNIEWVDLLIKESKGRASVQVPRSKSAPPSTDREYSDETVQEALTDLLEDHHHRMNGFQKDFAQSVGTQTFPITDRQYTVAVKICAELEYPLKESQQPAQKQDDFDDVPF